MKLVHTFSRAVLKSQGKAIKNPRTEKKILYTYDRYVNLRKLIRRPYIFPEENVTERKIVELSDYSDLKKNNLVVASIRTSTPWFVGQKVRYILTDKRIPQGNVYWNNCPQGVKIQYDKVNEMVRLIGKNVSPTFMGPWRRIE